MGNEAWIAIRRAAEAGLNDDGDMLEYPPRTEEEVGFLADQIADHVVGAIDAASREALRVAEREAAHRARRRPRRWLGRRPPTDDQG